MAWSPPPLKEKLKMRRLRPRLRLPLRLRSWSRSVLRFLPPLNFITLHYIYFIGVCLVSSVILWGSATPFRSVRYIDALFLAVSAMTLAGLNTINLSSLNTFQQILLFLLILVGSGILVSAAVLYIRKRAFEVKFQRIVEEERKRRRSRNVSRRSLSISRTRHQGDTSAISLGLPSPNVTSDARSRARGDPVIPEPSPDGEQSAADPPPAVSAVSVSSHPAGISPSQDSPRIAFSPGTQFRSLTGSTQARRPHPVLLSMQGVGAYADAVSPHHAPAADPLARLEAGAADRPGIYLEKRHSSLDIVGRNSQFHHLSPAEREELGGVEYRAIQILAVIVPLYYVLWLLLGCLGIGAYLAVNKASVTLQNGLNPWWVGAFNAASAFNNSGMSLLDANMIPFQRSTYMVITMGLLILAGNTCYPIFLRLIIWTLRYLLPAYEEALQFLLDHPRRCYTNLFPSAHTTWLLLSVVVLNSTDWIAFEILNIGNAAVSSIPHGARVLDGLFQALAVRSGGFYIISIASLRIGLQILYVIMMYISVFPVVITMRNSNVYEERSLGLYAEDIISAQQPSEDAPSMNFVTGFRHRLQSVSTRVANPSYFVSQQLRAQLAHDLWWIVLAVLFIAIIETSQFERDPVTYSAFNIIFEVVSAYGCVGISTGLPDQAYSFSGGWHTLSKLILCAVMLRGRHRGLPVAIDRAVLLPGEHLAKAEEEDAQIRLERTWSRGRATE